MTNKTERKRFVDRRARERLDFDVLIVGGGAAGVAAGVTAARRKRSC